MKSMNECQMETGKDGEKLSNRLFLVMVPFNFESFYYNTHDKYHCYPNCCENMKVGREMLIILQHVYVLPFPWVSG